jgi:hypothetical protein
MDADLPPDAERSERRIAASVDSGLAGLLGSLLSASRDEPTEVEAPADSQPVWHADQVEVSQAPPQAPPQQALPQASPGGRLSGQPPTASAPNPVPTAPAATTPAPEARPERVRLRQAVEEGRKRRVLNAKQLTIMLEGLSLLRARPGEEGLPPAMLMLDIRITGSLLPSDGLYAIRTQIDKSVRSGDVAVVVPDLGIVLFCGGLFFPGDLEVMGARVRRRALDRPTSFVADEVRVVVAGALSMSGEDPISFINRGVEAFEDSIEYDRQDILIDYGGQPSEFLF